MDDMLVPREEISPKNSSLIEKFIVDAGGFHDLIDPTFTSDMNVALPYLIAGIPKVEVARIVGINSATIDIWFSTNPKYKRAVAMGSSNWGSFILNIIRKLTIKSYEKLEEILYADPEGIKILQEQSKVAKFIVEHHTMIEKERAILASRAGDVDSDRVLAATKETLSMLADLVVSKQKKIDRDNVIDVITPRQKYMAPDGKPLYGEFGEFEKDDDKTRCHICGRYYSRIANHLVVHGIERETYMDLFGVDVQTKEPVGE